MKVTAADWNGEAASRSMRAHDNLVKDGDHHAAGLGAVVKGIERAVDAIPHLHRLIDEAEELARKYGYRVGENGELTDQFEGQDPPKDMHPEDRARAKQEITAKLQQAVRTGTDVDNDLTEVFDTASAGLYGIGQTGSLSTAAAAGSQAVTASPPAPPKHGTPAQKAAWWRSLSGAEQNTIIQHKSDQIGNLDGVPAEARSKANMNRLPQMKKRLLHQIRNGWTGSSAILEKLNSVEKVLKTMHQKDGQHRQLISLDDSDKHLQAAVGVGDVDNAENVAVFTPGLNTTVNDSLGGYDSDMRSIVNSSDKISDKYDGAKSAAVTWFGYQTPQPGEIANPVRSFAGPIDAVEGGQDLNKFYNGIEESRNGTDAGSPHLTGLGHSYGSVTNRVALGANNTPVDDAVQMGSPGMVTPDPKIPKDHLYGEWNKGDFVPYTNGAGTLGANTYGQSHVLSTDESTGPDGPLKETTGHSFSDGYLADRSTSQHNVASIVSGHPELAKSTTPKELLQDHYGAGH